MKVFESQLPAPFDFLLLLNYHLNVPLLQNYHQSSELSLNLTSTDPQLDDSRSIEPLQSSSTSYEVSINERQIKKFVLKEVKVKLEHGHSIATTEEHLKMLLSYWVVAESPQNGVL